jgi:hypothetical protein
MIKKNLLYLYCIVCFTFLVGNVNAQKMETKDYATHPYWIDMMKDTNTNYFEAVKAFNTYWSGREKPQSENEKFENEGNGNSKAKSKNIPNSFEYKKFQLWQMRVKPYVQNDGSILFPYQQHQLRKDARSSTPTKQ